MIEPSRRPAWNSRLNSTAPRRLSTRALAEYLHDRVFFGEVPRFVLGIDLLAVDDDVEDPAAAHDQRRLRVELVLESGLQTGGLG